MSPGRRRASGNVRLFFLKPSGLYFPSGPHGDTGSPAGRPGSKRFFFFFFSKEPVLFTCEKRKCFFILKPETLIDACGGALLLQVSSYGQSEAWCAEMERLTQNVYQALSARRISTDDPQDAAGISEALCPVWTLLTASAGNENHRKRLPGRTNENHRKHLPGRTEIPGFFRISWVIWSGSITPASPRPEQQNTFIFRRSICPASLRLLRA